LRRWIVGGIAAVGLLGAAPVVAPAATSTAHVQIAAKRCGSGWTHAVIGGAEKCLRRGQYCASAYKRQYNRYGFSCVAGRLR
jgi:hypothetical protein